MGQEKLIRNEPSPSDDSFSSNSLHQNATLQVDSVSSSLQRSDSLPLDQDCRVSLLTESMSLTSMVQAKPPPNLDSTALLLADSVSSASVIMEENSSSSQSAATHTTQHAESVSPLSLDQDSHLPDQAGSTSLPDSQSCSFTVSSSPEQDYCNLNSAQNTPSELLAPLDSVENVNHPINSASNTPMPALHSDDSTDARSRQMQGKNRHLITRLRNVVRQRLFTRLRRRVQWAIDTCLEMNLNSFVDQLRQ